MKNTTLHNVVLHVDVETIHGDYTEFVLDRACDRTDTDYYLELETMLDEDLETYGAIVDAVDCYYKVNMSIRVMDMDDVDQVLQICDETVARWKSRYNVDQMIRHENHEYAA